MHLVYTYCINDTLFRSKGLGTAYHATMPSSMHLLLTTGTLDSAFIHMVECSDTCAQIP